MTLDLLQSYISEQAAEETVSIFSIFGDVGQLIFYTSNASRSWGVMTLNIEDDSDLNFIAGFKTADLRKFLASIIDVIDNYEGKKNAPKQKAKNVR